MAPNANRKLLEEVQTDLTPPTAAQEQRSLESMASRNVRALVEAGLIREKFVLEATPSLLTMLEYFAGGYAHTNVSINGTIGVALIREKILTPQLIENVILADETNLNKRLSNRWANFLKTAASPGISRLIKNGFFEASGLTSMLRHFHTFYNGDSLHIFKSAVTPGASNAINWGITGILEYEAVQRAILMTYPRNYDFVDEPHPLLRAMRTYELVNTKRKQVEEIIPADDNRPFRAQMEALWRHYAAQSELFHSIAKESPVPAEERATNVARVNNWQARESRNEVPSPQQRFIDIYGRYNHAEMDPLMLAIIARTVGWYIDNGHASLFTDIRLVPDYRSTMPGGNDAVPWSALTFYPNMSILKLKNYDFVASILGANRIYLTHSQAKEASDLKSIPIIGIATWRNPEKLDSTQPHALLAAEFDLSDPNRITKRSWPGDKLGASFKGVIEETLRAVREAETLEIARANHVELVKYHPYRWHPAGTGD